jgi:transposase
MTVREDIASRLNGGQPPSLIAKALEINKKTVYRLKKAFYDIETQSYTAVPAKRGSKGRINREQLVRISQIMQANSKTTLEELAEKAVEEGIFTAECLPDTSTIYRALRRVGFTWRKPKFVDPNSKNRGLLRTLCLQSRAGRWIRSNNAVVFR